MNSGTQIPMQGAGQPGQGTNPGMMPGVGNNQMMGGGDMPPPQPPQQPAPPPPQTEQPLPDSDNDESNAFDIALQSKNLAEKLDDKKLLEIGEEAKRGFEDDEKTCKQWMDEIYDWLNLAKQLKEMKTYPWPGASSVKYPIISTAAMQFSARAYPSLFLAMVTSYKHRYGGTIPRVKRTSLVTALVSTCRTSLCKRWSTGKRTWINF